MSGLFFPVPAPKRNTGTGTGTGRNVYSSFEKYTKNPDYIDLKIRVSTLHNRYLEYFN